MRTQAKASIVMTMLVLLFAASAFSGERLTPNAWAAFLSAGMSADDIADMERNGGEFYFYNCLGSAEHYADSILVSLSAHRSFVGTLPSVAAYRQADTGFASVDAMAMAPAAVRESNWDLWATPWRSSEIHRSEDRYLGYKSSSVGSATGLARRIGENSIVGLAVGYDYRKQSGRDGYFQNEKTDAFHAALYGGTAIGCFFVDGYAGYSRGWHRANRNYYTAKGDNYYNHNNYNDTVLSAGLKAGYTWILPNRIRITPSVGLDYAHVRQGASIEREFRPFPNTYKVNLNIAKTHFDTLQMPVMISAGKTFSSRFLAFGGADSLWTPEVRAGWIPQFGARRAQVNAIMGPLQEWVPSKGFNNSNSTTIGRGYGTVGASLNAQVRGRHTLAVNYNFTFRSKYRRHALSATYGVSF